MGRYKRSLPLKQQPAEKLTPLRQGQVVTTHGRIVIVEDVRGELAKCSLRRKVGRVVCGDQVAWRTTTRGQGVVESVYRSTALVERRDAGGHRRPLAANVDQILVIAAPRPPLTENLIDRYLAAAELTGAEAAVVINKADLLDKEQRDDMRKRLSVYAGIGYPVLFCSTHAAHGTDQLLEALHGRTSIFVGQSGTGKSSLIRALLPDRQIRIGHLSSATGLGRHTTTNTTLYHLSTDSHLIDSPGVRDFQLWDVAPNQVAGGFREFRPYLGRCRYNDCRHLQEPGCAIQAAADNGDISGRRLDSYRKIVHELGKQR